MRVDSHFSHPVVIFSSIELKVSSGCDAVRFDFIINDEFLFSEYQYSNECPEKSSTKTKIFFGGGDNSCLGKSHQSGKGLARLLGGTNVIDA